MTFLKYSYEIFDLTQYKIENIIDKTDNVIIIFGKIAQQTLTQFIEEKQIENIKIISLPNLSSLTATEENKFIRIETKEKIENLNSVIETLEKEKDIIAKIKKEDLPDLTITQLYQLISYFKENKEDHIISLTKNGKLIKIINKYKKSQQPQNAGEILLSIEDIIKIKYVMETLNIEEVNIE